MNFLNRSVRGVKANNSGKGNKGNNSGKGAKGGKGSVDGRPDFKFADATQAVGSLMYMAPELFATHSYNEKVVRRSAMWLHACREG